MRRRARREARRAAFDLTGPRVEMKVSRAGKSLPIAEVANFQSGDRIWIHPDFPESQSVNYLMIVAFLRGSTNPPPEDWFTRAETWNKKVREEGIVVTVPKDAQQVLVFLAPDTSGGFVTPAQGSTVGAGSIRQSNARSEPGWAVSFAAGKIPERDSKNL